MRDGGEVKGTVDKSLNSTLGSGANHFGRSISRIAVAQVCKDIGFEGFSESALDSVSDIAIRYIFDLGRASKFYANLAGRTDCNMFDIIQGLEDLRMSQSFSGVYEVHNECIMSAGAIKEIKEYLDLAEEIPFAQSLPRFPVTKVQRKIPSFLQMGEVPNFKHIPAWLPAFPDIHTYVQTPVWNERLSDPRTDKIELARQRRKAESSLLSLQQRLVRTGSSMSASSVEPRNSENGLEVNEIVLAKPYLDGERDTSQVNLPVKLSKETHVDKHVSLLEVFAPAIEALKDGRLSESHKEKILPHKRASVLLDFKGGKKVPGESMDLRIRNKSSGKTAAWFGREDENNDKKRRAEYVLRQSMENQQETPHM